MRRQKSILFILFRASKPRGENEEKAKKPPALEIKSVWKKQKSPEKPTRVSKPRGENEEKAKAPPAREIKSVWKNQKSPEKPTVKNNPRGENEGKKVYKNLLKIVKIYIIIKFKCDSA